MSDNIGTFSMSGRSTNHVLQRPSIINNLDVQGRIPNNAPRYERAQADTRTFGVTFTQKARAIAKSRSTTNSEAQKARAIAKSRSTTNSEAVPASPTSTNQTDVSAAPVMKKKKKKGRGCNKGEEAPANPADRRHISLTRLGGWSDEKVARTIGSHLRTGLKGGHPNWTKMPKDNKRTLWNKFESTYVWDPVEDGAVRALWEHNMAESLSDAVYVARKKYLAKKKKPKWCADQHWLELLAYWESPEFLRRSKAAKANRSKGPRVCHTTGSKTMERAAIEKAKERGVPEISFIENYADTHTMRNPNDPNATEVWVDPKFKDAYDRYVENCIEDFGEDRTVWPTNVDAEKWTKAIGSPQKGRIMGLSIHMYPEELGFNTRKRSLFPRVHSSSQESRRDVIELRHELDEVKKVATDAMEKCTELQAELVSQKNQNAELMEFVRSQNLNNRRSQDAIGSSSVGGIGRHAANEQYDVDDFLGEAYGAPNIGLSTR